MFVSGTSSRRADNTIAGAEVDAQGVVTLDIRAQTRVVLENIRDILESQGAALSDLVEASAFLVDMITSIFHQFKGNAHLLILDRGKYERVDLGEGDIFLMAPHVLHSPQRPEAPSRCSVIERRRPAGLIDAFLWNCATCAATVRRIEVQLENIVTDGFLDEAARGAILEKNAKKFLGLALASGDDSRRKSTI